jgi:hypothetical protein
VLCLIVFSRMALRRVTQAEDESKKRNMRKLRKQIRRR